jgi:hypothetical protein
MIAMDLLPLINAAIPNVADAVPPGPNMVSPLLADIAQASAILDTELHNLPVDDTSLSLVPNDGTPTTALLDSGGTLPTALLDSGASVPILDPRYDTLLWTFTQKIERVDNDLDLIGRQFDTSRHGLDTVKHQFQQLTRRVAEDIGTFRSELNQIKEDVRRFGSSMDNGVDA